MKFFATFLLSISLIFIQCAQAYPILSKKALLLTPTSPVFTLLAIHKGNLTQADIVTFNKTSITIGNRGSPLFGRIDAQNNYTFNIASFNNINSSTSNSKNSTFWSINAYVDESNDLLTVATHNKNESSTFETESTGFAIENGYLSYKNSTHFLACPTSSSLTTNNGIIGGGNGNNFTNSSINGDAGFEIYANPKGKTTCPKGIEGYDIKLLTELIVTYSYSEKFNSNGFFKRQLSKDL